MEREMQREDDLQYYYKRAETELERAQRAVDPAAVKAHYLLAGYYLDRVYNRETVAGHAH
jgi:hypothetical protein